MVAHCRQLTTKGLLQVLFKLVWDFMLVQVLLVQVSFGQTVQVVLNCKLNVLAQRRLAHSRESDGHEEESFDVFHLLG